MRLCMDPNMPRDKTKMEEEIGRWRGDMTNRVYCNESFLSQSGSCVILQKGVDVKIGCCVDEASHLPVASSDFSRFSQCCSSKKSAHTA